MKKVIHWDTDSDDYIPDTELEYYEDDDFKNPLKNTT